jgi:hypothetical protein
VPYQLNGKPCWFTFNLLRHFGKYLVTADTYPSRTSHSDLSSKRKSYSDRWSCVACFLLRSLPSFIFSGGSQRTEYLRFGHSSAVWLRCITFHSLREMTPEDLYGHSSAVRLSVTFHSLREMTPEFINGTLKRRSAYTIMCELTIKDSDT